MNGEKKTLLRRGPTDVSLMAARSGMWESVKRSCSSSSHPSRARGDAGALRLLIAASIRLLNSYKSSSSKASQRPKTTLMGEMAVEGALPNLRHARDFVHTGVVYSLVSEETPRYGQDSLSVLSSVASYPSLDRPSDRTSLRSYCIMLLLVPLDFLDWAGWVSPDDRTQVQHDLEIVVLCPEL